MRGLGRVHSHRGLRLPKSTKTVKDRGLVAQYALDAISIGTTFTDAAECLPKAEGGGKRGTLAVVRMWPEGLSKLEGVETGFVMAIRLFGERQDLCRWFFKEWLEKGLADGSIVPAPEPQIIEGGVSAAQKVFDQMKAGVSGKKLVVEVE
jgi:hypothetical protein